MFQRLLICTDFSDGLHRLTQFVPSLADGGATSITFLHCVSVPDDREIPRIDSAELQEARDRLTPAPEYTVEGVTVQVEVEVGRPGDLILKIAQKYEADLIILGTPIRSLLSEKLFGSTTMQLCQKLERPILSLRPQLVSTYTSAELELRCRSLNSFLLLPYDGSETADYLIEFIKKEIAQPGHTLQHCLLLWVLEETGPRSIPRPYNTPEEAREKLQSIQQDLVALGVDAHMEVREGEFFEELMDTAMEYDISAIAIAHSNRGNWFGLSSGQAEDLLRRSWHPVLYLPQ